MDPVIELRKRVSAYLKAQKITATGFGLLVANNPSLVSRLKAGRITLATLRRVATYLDKHER